VAVNRPGDPAEPLRLVVEGDGDLVFEVDPADRGAGRGPSAEVRPLPLSADDRHRGRRRFEVTIDGWVLRVAVMSAARARLEERAGQAAGRAGPRADHVVRAQIPGRITRIWVAEGDTVEAGQRLLAIEAMKMENELRSPRAGVVASLRAVAGAGVELGEELLTVR
jgi:biotin carboxyl carrier protein